MFIIPTQYDYFHFFHVSFYKYIILVVEIITVVKYMFTK